MEELLEKLLQKLEGANKVVFMGIGEEKLADDGFGPYVITHLLDYSDEKYLFMNASVDPMARIDEIVDFNPSHLVLLDTCTLKKPPGTIAFLEREDLAEYVAISSHTIPVHVVVDLILEQIPGLKIFMIGVVPESLKGITEFKFYKEETYSLEERSENIDLPFFNLNLTDTVKKSADEIIKIIKQVMLTI